ncbi:hypothetical protein FOZ61_010374 [Perkinsus olseni]|uniref:Uncharacterized protein n=1 Tax=Perkinsus olseni TaxID=32597 RepID=A0A7J6KW29_PEROL|nr:hypothetical protein FOZ61_010374 [Perkinsus olseni]
MIELRKNAVKFSGGADEDVEEWLDKLDMIAGPEGFNLDYYDQAVLLKLSVSGPAYQAAKMVPCEQKSIDPSRKRYLARLRSELRKRFGSSPDKAVASLRSVSVNDYTSVDEYATAVSRLVRQSFSNIHIRCQGEIMKLFFYSGLPHDHPASSAIKPFCLDPTKSYEQIITRARLSFDNLSQPRVAAPGVRRFDSKSGKGW